MHLVFASGFLVPQRLIGVDYFRGVSAAFPDAIFPAVSPIASIAQRASTLADAIQTAFPSGPIHVVAHSLGGLDTRFVLARNLRGLGAPGRIVALSTISTPHRGSPIADLLVGPEPGGHDFRTLNYRVIRALAADIGLDADALAELSSGFAAAFNRDCPDVAHVLYRSYAGGAQESIALKAAHLYCEFVGATADDRINDGLVPLASARWGTFVDPVWPTDHIGEVGHSLNAPALVSRFDHLTAYRQIVDSVAAAAAARGLP